MFIKPGDIVSLSHYSKPFQIKSIVLDVTREISDDVLSIKVTKQFAEANLLEGDPAVLGLERSGQVYLTNCYVNAVIAQQGVVRVSINNEEFIVNNRAHERFPVSLYADIKNSIHSFVSIVKNISYSGLMIYSKKDLSEGDFIDMVLYLGSDQIPLGAKIMWKMTRQTDNDYDEYGLKITYMDFNSQTILASFIKRLKEQQEEFIRRLKE